MNEPRYNKQFIQRILVLMIEVSPFVFLNPSTPFVCVSHKTPTITVVRSCTSHTGAYREAVPRAIPEPSRPQPSQGHPVDRRRGGAAYETVLCEAESGNNVVYVLLTLSITLSCPSMWNFWVVLSFLFGSLVIRVIRVITSLPHRF